MNPVGNAATETTRYIEDHAVMDNGLLWGFIRAETKSAPTLRFSLNVHRLQTDRCLDHEIRLGVSPRWLSSGYNRIGLTSSHSAPIQIENLKLELTY